MAKRTNTLISEPIWEYNSDDPDWEFFSCVNKYRTQIHPTLARNKKWVMEYMKWKKFSKEDIEAAQRGNSWTYDMVGSSCRICTQSDHDAPESWQKRMDKHISGLIKEGKNRKAERKEKEENKPVKVKVSIQDRIKNQVGEYISMLYSETDVFLNKLRQTFFKVKIF